MVKGDPTHAPSLIIPTPITGSQFHTGQNEKQDETSFLFFHTNSATTENHSCEFLVIIAAQVFWAHSLLISIS